MLLASFCANLLELPLSSIAHAQNILEFSVKYIACNPFLCKDMGVWGWARASENHNTVYTVPSKDQNLLVSQSLEGIISQETGFLIWIPTRA